MANWTQLCNLNIWIKARGVITENTVLLKDQKQAITAAWNGEDAPMLLPNVLRKLWIYLVISLIVNRDTSPIGIKVSYREFYWSAIRNFIPSWESEIVNESVLQEIDVITQKWELRSYFPVKFSSHRPRESGKIPLFICHVITWPRH